MQAADDPKQRAWYGAAIETFLADSVDAVLGKLAARSPFAIDPTQRDAWVKEIALLKGALAGIDGWVFFEFDVPRLGSRIDVVVVTTGAVIPIEFKIGATEFARADREQVWDYALDLKNFHAGSHAAAIFPILCASEAEHDQDDAWADAHTDGVRPPRRCRPAGLARAIASVRDEGAPIVPRAWASAPYEPTPTIIEAARALFARHSVEEISRHDAGARNLSVTSMTVDRIIDAAERERFKAIVFVTGVPGAGKTLVGLNVATRHRRTEDASHAVFLSGNGPLVAVLREALTRDEHRRRPGARKGAIGQEVKPFIQNVHHFRDEGIHTLPSGEPPHDRVVIFDEAQRAWNLDKTRDFMRRRKGIAGFERSEPQFLIEYMDRHPDWAVVVCLVGGGQEIHTGEAGISTWLDAVREHFPSWRVYISPELSDSEYAAGHALDQLRGVAHVAQETGLHLSASMRSFRSEKVSAFVKALLDVDEQRAHALYGEISDRYPIVSTRDLDLARRWVRTRARGSERYGLVASSGAMRLKPHAVDVRVAIDPVKWFLSGRDDTRSSWYLEDAATQYQVQGLELDWTCVTWDADLRKTREGWRHFEFKGSRWQQIRKDDRRSYLLNAYRVLLTRARQGMVIFVPPGDRDDPTRTPEWYDAVHAYLGRLGIPSLESSRMA